MRNHPFFPFESDDAFVAEHHSFDSSQSTLLEESVFFDHSFGKQTEMPKPKMHLASFFSERSALALFLFFCFVFLGIVIRVLSLQIIHGSAYRVLAEGNRQRTVPIPSERGLIYDRYGVQLTKNIPNFSLALTPQDLPKNEEERNQVVLRLAEITGKKPETIRDTLNEYGNYSYESIILEEDLEYETALSIQIAAGDLPGLFIHRGSKRLYLFDQENAALSHVVGYEGKLSPEELEERYKDGYLPSDSTGKTGLEYTYESVMRGTYGDRHVEVNALGRERATLSERAPTPGDHLILAIDATMQKKMEEIIKARLAEFQKTRAAAVVMDPNTGEVMALVSIPSFDNNDFSGGILQEQYESYIGNPDKPLFPRAISGMYPSGSIIKPAIASAALEEGIITPQTSFLSTGGIQVGPWFFPDWLAGGHGRTDVRRSLANSVNTFYYYIGGGYGDFEGLGIDVMTAYLRQFGLSAPLGIDLPGEASGFLPSKEWKEQTKHERWYIGDTYNISIGQGDLLVTPLQVAAMTSVIANGGTLVKPHVVTHVVDGHTKEQKTIPNLPIRKEVVHSSHLDVVRLGMRDCVVYGSCRRLSLLSLDIAGKTGTAQWSSLKENHAWVTSFAPFENPEIVVSILIEEGEEGSKTAMPIAYDFYAWWSAYRQETKPCALSSCG